MKGRKLIFLELNEINFDLARRYLNRLRLPSIEKLCSSGVKTTSAESDYSLLEPWIQWVSVRTGLSAAEHGVFCLGDMEKCTVQQFYETLESKGYRVGAISPINATNRMRQSAYFIPDPWVNTSSDDSRFSRKVSAVLSRLVNQNASGKFRLTDLLVLLVSFLLVAPVRRYHTYLWLAVRSIKAPWRKALFLDLFLHDLHLRMLRKRKPDFSTVFFNAGAHIQHHYLFSSKALAGTAIKNPAWYVRGSVDPVAEMLKLYDEIIGEYIERPDTSVIIATGLTQQPYDRVKFYYRLTDHELFLRTVGLKFKNVQPLMSRDFIIHFETEHDATLALNTLTGLTCSTDGEHLFGEMQNRGQSIFATLSYPNEVTDDAMIQGVPNPINLIDHVSFVAVKNGMHSSTGYVFYKGSVSKYAAEDGAHVKELHKTVLKYFGV